jgi:hypothetical protein
MCIAIFKPKLIRINKKSLKNCFVNNPDGAGYVAHNESKNKLIVKKGFFTFESFWASVKEDMHMKMLLHFRIATHGETNESNCHPFIVNENLAFIHNGIIRDVRQWNKAMSDTWHFNEAIMKPLVKDNPDIWRDDVVALLIENYIGAGSKLVFMNNKGKVRIFNEKAGIMDCDCWWSNASYRAIRVKQQLPYWNQNQSWQNQSWQNQVPTKYRGRSQSDFIEEKQTALKEIILDDVDEALSDYYRGQDQTVDELLLETLFKECEEEELKRDYDAAEEEKMNKFDMNVVI